MFSITLCTHNKLNHLKTMIYSITNQTFSNFELIVINDASTDETDLFLEDLSKKDKRIKITTNKFNLGLQKSRILGAKKAKFKYLIQLDNDDFLYPLTLERYAEILKIDNYDFIITDHSENSIELDNHIKPYFLKFFQNYEDLPSNLLIPKSIWRFCINTELANKIYDKLNCKVDYGEDLVFVALLYKKSNRFCYANFNSINYEKKTNTMSDITTFNQKKILEFAYCHSYPSKIWDENSLSLLALKHFSLNFLDIKYKVIKKISDKNTLSKVKKIFQLIYKDFMFEETKIILKNIYPNSEKFISIQSSNFLKEINE